MILRFGPALALVALGGAAMAEPPAAPASPDDPSKFFWFHKPGVAADTARTDVRWCMVQSATIVAKTNVAPAAGGLLGAFVVGMLQGVTQGVESRRMRDASLRRCMGLYGYDRYALAETQFNAMTRGDGALERLVAFTTGPVPVGARLEP